MSAAGVIILSMILVDEKDDVNSTRQERETAGFTKFDFCQLLPMEISFHYW